MLVVSNSKVNTWRRCHMAYHYKYNEKLRPRKKATALRRGTILHECIEAYDSGRSWKKVFDPFAKEFYRTTFSEEILEIGDIPDMVRELMENYQALYDEDGLEYLGSEVHFQLPLVRGIIEIEGYLDAIVRDGETGQIWCKETKTYTRNPDRDFLVMNTQSSLYLWAMSHLGYRSTGTLWDIVRAKRPQDPRMTTRGISMAKLDSTPYTIAKWLKANGFKPEDYPTLTSHGSFDKYFTREKVRINKTIAEGIMQDFVDTARQIYDCGSKYKDRNLGKNCAWCEYKPLCQAELQGLDVGFIRQRQFEVREGEGRDGKKDTQEGQHK